MNKISWKYYFLIIFLSTSLTSLAQNWQPQDPDFKQEFDWLKLTSDEWLKGNIISMYDEKLEFDSDNLGLLSIDWDDVAELRSKDVLSIRLQNNIIVEGYIIIQAGKLALKKQGETQTFSTNSLISIASSGENEWDLWDGYLKLGSNLSAGNTNQTDLNISAGIQRRSSISRFKTDLTASYSQSKITNPDGSKTNVKVADSQRLTSIYDWFFSQKIFFRAADFEYFSDEFLNIDSRISYGVALGYQVYENKKSSWEVTAGPSYQQTTYLDVLPDENSSETSAVLALGTNFEYEITKNIDFDTLYEIKMVSEASGDLIHHFEAGFDVDFLGDLDVDLRFYLDRTENPKANDLNNIPEKSDYRLVLGLGYDF